MFRKKTAKLLFPDCGRLFCRSSFRKPTSANGRKKLIKSFKTLSIILNNFTNPKSMMNFGFMPFGGFGWIFMILWWVLIIAGIIALIRWLTNQSRDAGDNEQSALDVLKKRYAKGEVGKKEFEEKKKDLSK